ncbi:helix-turn-helix transcriptional regulator [Streptomyces sp. B21-083]|uniref:helix-turn-helix transcriptional regulator n=1 Tax=Streptomyces sp. B21-083 TaxID=3039410 RepID=UPI003FA78D0A
MDNAQNGLKNCSNHSDCARNQSCGPVPSSPVRLVTRNPAAREASEPVDGWGLSSIQARILEGVAAGLSSGRLSREMYLSSKTIDYHVRVMSDKLQASNRVALVSRAYVLKILITESWPPRVACDAVN